jgi:hypothetical protein
MAFPEGREVGVDHPHLVVDQENSTHLDAATGGLTLGP